MLATLLLTRYGRHADSFERFGEIIFSVAIVLSSLTPSSALVWFTAALGTGVITLQTLEASWEQWALPPIAAPPRVTSRSFISSSLLSGPFVVTLLVAVFKVNLLAPFFAFLTAVALTTVYPYTRCRRTGSHRRIRPVFEGAAAFIEFNARRMRFPSTEVVLAFLFPVIGVAFTGVFAPAPWALFGVTVSLLIRVTYRERGDLPGKTTRLIVRLPEFLTYLPKIVMSVMCLVVGVVLLGDCAPLFAWVLAASLTAFLACYGSVTPYEHAPLRLSTMQPRPTFLKDAISQILVVTTFLAVTLLGLL
ncbi:hypothetical protein [Corynebacterium cystitidis]|uniref:Uncharacterized protein n=1 Tax=Corynebacterium cystitidis DSM 20524 TaxID=1121357 RepID=A0A1H9WGP7_9CORY|nr:hypothetical protein [Corynebacterium cystitidis]WJY81861.1 hypothetical protein CCYS_04575 [Corynebacterium cystitidis DSM 20524]SES33015.1 hypothetical protein SAMN05661109_02721 [Corynebacterium cystitidis DSM 20524]SNV82691.1 Uncharacterised protein [Corynebacterium cystitidis]